MQCLLDLSSYGLEPDGRRAHLIPFGDKCTLIIDYKGLAELAMRTGIVSKLHADVICENDEFAYDMGEVLHHKIDFRKPRGQMYAAYAVAKLKDGQAFCQVLSKDEIDGIRKRSRASGSGPWVTDYNEMAKKTAFRRLSKWLPLSAEFRDAQERDDEEYEVRDVTPQEPRITETEAIIPGPKRGRPKNVSLPPSEERQEQAVEHQPAPQEPKNLDLRDAMSADGVSLQRINAVCESAAFGGPYASINDIPANIAAGLLKSWDSVKEELL